MQDLSSFSAAGFDRGASIRKEAFWCLIRCCFFLPPQPLPSSLRVFWLRLFGASVGKGVVIRSGVKITFPWRLLVGDYAWVGEDCWLLNLAKITIESHVCISQRAFLCTGNHDFASSSFDLITKEIRVEQGAWLGASTFVAPGVVIGKNAVLTAGSVAKGNLDPFGIYQGNPANKIKMRTIKRKNLRAV